MSNSSKLFVFAFVVIILLLSITYILITLVEKENLQNEKNDPITQTPISYSNDQILPTDNKITIDESKTPDFMYAVITNEDTVVMFDQNGNKTPLNLDHRNWRDIRWSKDSKRIGVIGLTSNDTENLLIFDLESRLWLQATNYSNQNGVEKFIWLNGDTIVFTQGKAPNHWLHSYKISSLSEIKKLNQVDGYPFIVSADVEKLIFKSNQATTAKFTLTSSNGEELYALNTLKTEEDKTLTITNVLISPNSEKILFKTKDYIYKHLYGNNQIVQLADTQNLEPVCFVTEDVVYVVVAEEGQYALKLFNTKTENLLVKDIVTMEDKSMKFSLDGSTCFGKSNIMLKFDIDSQTVWYSLNPSDKLMSLSFLKNAKEVSGR